MFAPKRGTTFDDFVSLAKSVFTVEVMENYDDTIWDLHCKVICFNWSLTLMKNDQNKTS